jgi:two-component system CheB/CheR fusion protein
MSAPDPPLADLPNPEPKGASGPEHEPIGQSPFPIVGIGASAGGLEAFTQLLANLPTDTGMAFLLVQHLDPHHESRLTDLLGRVTSMPVLEAEHGLAVQPNHVYIIPPNTSMALGQGLLHVTPRAEARRPHLPIDYLFRSLATDQQERAIAVVLSGTGSDGTQGVCEVKAVGGITFAQDERTAAHPGMPHSASESGCADFVLPPGQIARRLAEIGEHPYLAPAPGRKELEPSAEESYQRILATVRDVTGVDFGLYRDTTIKRRIMRRMALHTQQSLADYAERLQKDQGEVEALYYDLLINVTSFFRDPEMFEVLKSSVFPELARGKAPADPFRIWVPGCSTGQEAFSLAMALIEFYDSQPVRPPIQVFCTDLSDQTALDKARAGIYPEGIEGEVSPERLRRFFRREDHVYRIDKSIRDVCVFARHNVTADPPFSHLDLISCRNVLIYLTTPLQKRILPTFHYALDVPGYLVLGTAETVGEFTDLFELRDRTHRIYAKKANLSRQHVFFTAPDHKAGVAFGPRRSGPSAPVTADFQKEADRILLSRYAPPGVLVDENFDILHLRGRTSPYLELPPGEPTASVLKLAREGLFLELRSALAEAKKQQRAVRRTGIRLRSNGTVRDIVLEVIPVHPHGSGTSFLVLFQEAADAPAAHASGPPEPPPSETEAVRELIQLRQELAATREYLQSMIEQQDAANEELRSANEEILSSNEELRSTNEELETAKEELQSSNEELTTVNEQLQRRNLELDQVNNDLINLFSSTNIPLVMVGGDLCIRRFTPPAKKVMSLHPSDIGRPIGDVRPALLVPDLEALLGEVIERVQPVEREVRDQHGRWYVLRVHPYRTVDHKIDGAVIVLVDIDQVRHTQDELQQQTDLLRQQASLLELSRDAIIVRDAQNRVVFWNRGAQETYGWTAEEAMGKPLDTLLQADSQVWAALNAQLDQTGTWEGEFQHTRQDGKPIVIHSREVLVRDEKGARSAVLAIKRDITEHKQMLEALKAADRRKDEFLATLAHELRNPLAPVRNAVEVMRLAGDDPSVIGRSRDVVQRQVSQLSRIVEDLIDVSRIVEKKIQLRKERVALGPIVETALETTRSAIEAYGHRLSVALPSEPLYLDADPVRISQILINLLNNASKYTEPGGQIWLQVERADDTDHPGGAAATDQDEVVMRVRDSGIGIRADLLPRVFEMFTQGDHSLERSRGGLGIGLTLVRSLVQMHGGSVEALSEGPGRGSEFVVRLPLADDAAPEPAAKAAAPPVEAGSAGPRRILVVDDNPDQAQSLGMLLKLMGHEVRLAYSGPEALQEAAAFVPDVALVDIGLPGMSGYEVARHIRAQPRLSHLVLVAQTGWGQDEDRRRSQEAGFDYHFVKPVTPEAIEEIIRTHPRKK